MSTKKIGGFSEAHLMKVAKDNVEKKTKDSVILDVEAEKRIPKFQLSEFTLGRVLGRGGFCVVTEIQKITLSDGDGSAEKKEKLDDEHHILNVVQDRDFMTSHCIRQGKDARYAIKIVQDSVKKDPQTYVNGVVDLALEARFLTVIRHPNIIKMRAVAVGSPYDGKFFLVLDRLYDIMSDRLASWKKKQPGKMGKMLDRGGKKAMAFWIERITAGYDLACALKYLHDLRIIYRDIKPDNIGFDVRGDVKIFDFGLAKEIDPAKCAKDGTYKLTGDTGSPRYMAPEVAHGKPYNESCDVYSFSILLWQILKLETPFEGYSMKMFKTKVVEGGHRPKPDPKWPTEITDTLRRGWGVDIAKRPDIEEFSEILREIITQNSDEGFDEIMDASRKSEMSMRGMRS